MEAGRQPITFENPLYATAPGVSGDPAVIHATQVLICEWIHFIFYFHDIPFEWPHINSDDHHPTDGKLIKFYIETSF